MLLREREQRSCANDVARLITLAMTTTHRIIEVRAQQASIGLFLVNAEVSFYVRSHAPLRHDHLNDNLPSFAPATLWHLVKLDLLTNCVVHPLTFTPKQVCTSNVLHYVAQVCL